MHLETLVNQTAPPNPSKSKICSSQRPKVRIVVTLDALIVVVMDILLVIVLNPNVNVKLTLLL